MLCKSTLYPATMVFLVGPGHLGILCLPSSCLLDLNQGIGSPGILKYSRCSKVYVYVEMKGLCFFLIKFSQSSKKTLKKEVDRVRLTFPASASCCIVQAEVSLLPELLNSLCQSQLLPSSSILPSLLGAQF